jgi:hypothetical protein
MAATRSKNSAVAVFFALFATASAGQVYLENLPIAHRAIEYLQTRPDDAVSRLSSQLERGAATLDFRDDGTGYLASVLRHLGVNADSQGLVFSKTSSQAAKISPRNPRAIYFADDVAVGFVRGGEVLELAARDPRQGVSFYTLDNHSQARPAFTRREVCLRCHNGPATGGVPGMFVSSVFPSATGIPYSGGAIVTDHRTPFSDRYGGWYVNGRHGQSRHRGNAVAPNPARPDLLDTGGTQNLRTLAGRVDTHAYLSPGSDIVALLTFEHQTQMTNLITRLGWEARIAYDEPRSAAITPALQSSIDALVAYMLFADEAPLDDPVEGVSSFTRTFAERGPRDRKGRSLRDFDLRTRLFRYPLSYMVYDAAFDALPGPILDQVYRRLFDVLTETDDDAPTFARLTRADRRSIFEILKDTKANLPAYWRTAP